MCARVIFVVVFSLLLLANVAFGTGFGDATGTAAQSRAGIGTTASDVFSANNNQAGLGFIEDFGIGVFSSNRFLVRETSFFHLSSAFPTRSGTFGLTVNYRGSALFNEKQVGIGYGRSFGEKFAVGVQFDYLNFFLSEYGQKNLFTFEFGLQYKVVEQFMIAAHVYNPLRLTFEAQNIDRLSSIIRLGFRYLPGKNFELHGEVEKDIDFPVQVKLGAHYTAFEKVQIGAGIHANPFEGYFGVLALIKNLSIGVSGAFHPQLGFSPQASLSYVFRKKQK